MLGDEVNPIQEQGKVLDMSTILQKVFMMMSAGLLVTALTAFIVVSVPSILLMALQTYWVWAIAELILVLVLSANLTKMGKGTCKLFFYIYSIINGVTLSSIFLAYDLGSIGSTFLITSAMFLAISFYGKTTKKDLTGIGSFCLMGLVGIIIAAIVNIFIMNSMLDFIISVVGIILFIGITAYDIQKINAISKKAELSNEDTIAQVVVCGALNLYLDFINIFLKLLSILGRRRRN